MYVINLGIYDVIFVFNKSIFHDLDSFRQISNFTLFKKKYIKQKEFLVFLKQKKKGGNIKSK